VQDPMIEYAKKAFEILVVCIENGYFECFLKEKWPQNFRG